MREFLLQSGAWADSRTFVVMAVLYFGLGAWFIATGTPWPAVGFVVVGVLWLVARKYRRSPDLDVRSSPIGRIGG